MGSDVDDKGVLSSALGEECAVPWLIRKVLGGTWAHGLWAVEKFKSHLPRHEG